MPGRTPLGAGACACAGASGGLPAKLIATVRGGAFFAGAGSGSGAAGFERKLIGAFGISWVPGFFGTGGGVARDFPIALSSACWKGPLSERPLLTASGETCEGSIGAAAAAFERAVGSAPPGAEPREAAGGWTSDAALSPPAAAARAIATSAGDAVAANGSGLLGDPASDSGLTRASGANPVGALAALTFDDGLAGVDASPPLVVFGPGAAVGLVAGAPQAAQNFAGPISSAPHFEQFAMVWPSMLGHLFRTYK